MLVVVRWLSTCLVCGSSSTSRSGAAGPEAGFVVIYDRKEFLVGIPTVACSSLLASFLI